ncbi:MAG: phosphatidylglycerophosphatase A [Campylobacteraceae bacterium]|nr:phosphatidylglycerophosphatase A [Campylobacteraceae bacterium]
MQKAFLTFFYLGLLPKAPGTWGSIGGAILGYIILYFFTNETLFLATILISVIGVDQINKYEQITKTHDDKSIVIDEVAGVWLAFLISGGGVIQMLLSLVFFRIFDIWKPSFIGRIDRHVKGGLGVMGDDLLAGLVAGICSAGVYEFLLRYNLL